MKTDTAKCVAWTTIQFLTDIMDEKSLVMTSLSLS